jgi:hypothetical protein
VPSIPLTNGHGPQIGDPCPREACVGVLGVYSTKVIEEANVRVRYLRCNSCKARPTANQQVVPLKYAPPRPAIILPRDASFTGFDQSTQSR